MTQKLIGQAEPLVPETLRPKYDPATDKVLQAMRDEVLELLAKPFDPKALVQAQMMLGYAQEILQLRRGKATNGRKRGRSMYTVGGDDYTIGSTSSEFVDDVVLADAPVTETHGTHFGREVVGATGTITGLMARAIDVLEKKNEPLSHDKALAAESTVRAMVKATELPAEHREVVLGKLRGQFDGLLADQTYDSPPELVAHDHRPRVAPPRQTQTLVASEAAE